MGKKITCLGFYGASEALMGIEIPEISQGMHSYIPLYNDTVFSFTDVDHPHLPPLSFEELKKEGEYYINISSLSGFIQYALKDCIKITSISPYLTFQVLGRQDADLNLVSERISQKTVTEIIAELQNKIQCHIDHYFVYPIIQENCSYYGWILFSDNISIEKSCLIANIFDELLILRSNNYKKYRLIQNLIAVPKVKIIPKHLIQKYFERNSGKGQFKMKTIFKSHLEFEKFWKSEISDLERYL
ncbi:hypothetical protein AXG55_11215 [Silvanigrella aquatica]|uniref:GH3 middle domain-containing protein n=2 Tax=Silvanigrella aquatica TaxID=1915309 RepID=A0A1L4D2M1_9BACT|nr:hypothetical protein AXG55_11215 [Silvanigrella aquatica]